MKCDWCGSPMHKIHCRHDQTWCCHITTWLCDMPGCGHEMESVNPAETLKDPHTCDEPSIVGPILTITDHARRMVAERRK